MEITCQKTETRVRAEQALCPDFLLPGEASARPLKRFFEKEKTGPADSGTIQQRHRFDKN